MRLLIVEDEPRMTELLRQGLYERGFTVMSAGDGVAGLEIATAYQFDAIVLDIGLPLMDGYELMAALRKGAHSAPVLMLTARDSEDEIIRGLDLGADDYLTKPFSFPELAARLQAICRSGKRESLSAIEEGEVMVDLTRQAAKRGQSTVDLTRLEMLLLVCLMRDAGRCVPRQKLIDSVWGSEHAVGSSALDVLVNSLRAKIDHPFPRKLIGTVRGLGYFFRHTAPAAECGTS
jgi:DNA-binding response OmpR family regulator